MSLAREPNDGRRGIDGRSTQDQIGRRHDEAGDDAEQQDVPADRADDEPDRDLARPAGVLDPEARLIDWNVRHRSLYLMARSTGT